MELNAVAVKRGDRLLVESLDLKVNAGEILAIVGPNGAGKSTLLSAMAGQYDGFSGQIHCKGLDVAKASPRDLANRLGYLPQKVEAGGGLLVTELIELGRFNRSRGFLDQADYRAVARGIEVFGIEHLANQSIRSLSGGEFQRALLAMLFVQETEIVLLDEPLNHLDFVGQRHLLGLLAEMRSSGRGIVLVAHDINSIARRADRVLMLSGSGEYWLGSTPEVLTQQALSTAFGTEVKPISDPDGFPFIPI